MFVSGMRWRLYPSKLDKIAAPPPSEAAVLTVPSAGCSTHATAVSKSPRDHQVRQDATTAGMVERRCRYCERGLPAIQISAGAIGVPFFNTRHNQGVDTLSGQVDCRTGPCRVKVL